ncbi:MAG: serine hydrolase [Lysobacteraceae bacterium]|nr:MAG: serine hydrolase [Xanthomonadaceae bacterium]
MNNTKRQSGKAFVMLMAGCLWLILGIAHASNSDLSKQVDRGMQLWNVPGMAVAVVRDGDVAFQQGFGATSIDGGAVVDEHTLFAIASTTKAMIAAGILILADDGKLSLDDLVIEHIPELHFGDSALNQQLTIRDLLAHRTGLPSTNLWVFMQGMALDEQIRRLRLVDSASPPRARFIYQNTMYELAGLVIERVSNQSWHEFIKARLWDRLEMHATFAARGMISDDKVHTLPHYYVHDALVLADWDLAADHADAAGSVWSSIHDMTLWAQFLLRDGVTASGERLISEAGMAAMFEPQHLVSPGDFYPTVELTEPNWRSYGLGWFQQDFQGRKIDFHTGSLSGLIALIGLDRENKDAVIVLGNRDHAEMRHALLWEVMDHRSGQQRPDWNQTVFDLYQNRAEMGDQARAEMDEKRLNNTSPALPLQSYAGQYRDAVVGDFAIELVDGQLVLVTGILRIDMRHWHLDTFEAYKDEWDFRSFLSFQIGAAGTVTSMTVFGTTFQKL